MTSEPGAEPDDPWRRDVVVYRGSIWRTPIPFVVVPVLGIGAGLLVISSWVGRFLLLVNVAVIAYQWWAARAVTLSLSSAGIERANRLQGYSVRIPWADVEALSPDRIRGVQWWTLAYAQQELVPLAADGRVSARARRRADRFRLRSRFVLDAFTKDVPQSSLARRIHLARPDLALFTSTNPAPS